MRFYFHFKDEAFYSVLHNSCIKFGTSDHLGRIYINIVDIGKSKIRHPTNCRSLQKAAKLREVHDVLLILTS